MSEEGDGDARSSIRVLHVTEALGGGIHSLLLRLTGRQAESGADVAVAYLRRPEAPLETALAQQFDARVRLIPIRQSDQPLRRLLATFLAVRRAIRSRKYDVIHLHSSFAGVAGRLARIVTRGPVDVMYSPHGFAFLRLDSSKLSRLAARLVEAVLARASVLVLTCDSELATARAQLKTKNVALLHTGVDVQAYRDKRSDGDARPPIVLMIGRICYQKAPWRFAGVARALSGQARFVWVGDGDEADRDRWLGGAPVEVTGWLGEKELEDLLADTYLLLFPTLWEGMSMALMQAQAQGVPAVVSDAVGNRDAVIHGATGYVARDDEELAALTQTLLQDPELRATMSEAAITWARTSLTDQSLGQDSLRLYRESRRVA